LVLQAAPQPEDCQNGTGIRVGFTASRRVGGAVVRNRAKRRLRAAASNVLAYEARPRIDYVLIARAGTADRPFAALVADLQSALRGVATGSAGNRAVAAMRD
jgi:ribonuclease P protein component